jgi:hypothetical protein
LREEKLLHNCRYQEDLKAIGDPIVKDPCM